MAPIRAALPAAPASRPSRPPLDAAAAAARRCCWPASPATPGWRRGPPTLTDSDTILIGAFENTTGEPLFDDTLVTALRSQPAVAVPRHRPGSAHPRDAAVDEPQRGRTAGQRGVARGLPAARPQGDARGLDRRARQQLRASPRRDRLRSGETLAREQAEARTSRTSCSELGALSSRMRTRLGESLPSMQRFDVPIEQATTPSLTALKAYALGLEERRRGRELESVAFFNQAIELDPRVRLGLRDAVDGLRQPRRMEAQRTVRAARPTSARRTRQRARAAVHHLPVPRPRHRQPGEGGQHAGAVEGRLSPRVAAGQRAGADPQPAGAARARRRGVQEALRRSPGPALPALEPGRRLPRARAATTRRRRPAEQAVALGVATTPTRRLLYQLGMVPGDGSAAAHLAWAKDRSARVRPRVGAGAGRGLRGTAVGVAELYRRAIDMAMARGLDGTASGYAAHLAWTEALYGEQGGGRRRPPRPGAGRTTATRTGPARSPASAPPRRWRWSGRRCEALPLVTRAEERYPEATFVRTVLGAGDPCRGGAAPGQAGRRARRRSRPPR